MASFVGNDIIRRAQWACDRTFRAAGPAALLNTEGMDWLTDCYFEIQDYLREPRHSASIAIVTGTQAYTLPTDCFDGIDGIISAEYQVSIGGIPYNIPMIPKRLKQLQDCYGNTWQNPPDLQVNATDPSQNIWYFLEYNDPTSLFLVPRPTNSSGADAINLTYVQEQTCTDLTAAIPFAFKSFISIIPLYLAGRAGQATGQAKAGSFLQEFEGRLKKRWYRKERKGRTTASEAITQPLEMYRQNYLRRRVK